MRLIMRRPVFLGLYLSDVDHAGHMYGPESKQVEKELKDLDASILRLLKGVEGLSGRNWWDVVNVVVVSDHGMGLGNTREKFVFLDDFVDSARFSIVDDVVVHVYPNEGEDLNELFHHWKQASLTSGNWQVWKRDDCPAEFEYRGNERIGPIVVLPEPGWAVSKRVQGVLSKPFDIKGMHGYNNSHPDMRAIFLAGGPAFKTIPEEIPAFKNVEIHGLLSTLLRLKSSIPTNGTDSLSKYVDLK
ncbi:alkaline-phosphatase-like protein [Obelidium mucronatum]|nr:alkaline-phosphatase-like protein [Obelidium mucronatum]